MSTELTIEQQVTESSTRFTAVFGHPATHGASAPGRVNLIGEHTDYNAGFVLPIAIERQTVILACRRSDNRARIVSSAFDEPAEFLLDHTLEPGRPPWANYIRGVVGGYLARGMNPGGFDALLHSTVPTGGGLSSSASIEVASATLIEALAGPSHAPLSLTDKALLCQRAEHDFAGMPCGIMDPFVCTMAQAGHAVLIDCRSLAVEMVPLTDPSVAILIINSNREHELTGGEYAQRRAQCEQTAKTIGVPALRDAGREQLNRHKEELDDASFRRARHVIGENQRTLDAASAMRSADWATVGRLMFESHDSLRDDFEVSTPELDTLVEIAEEHCESFMNKNEAGHSEDALGGMIGSRMSGGGFGGCTVSLVHARHAQALTRSITRAYRQRTGIDPSAFITRPAPGARVIDLSS